MFSNDHGEHYLARSAFQRCYFFSSWTFNLSLRLGPRKIWKLVVDELASDRSGTLSHLGVTNAFNWKKEGFTSIIDESCFTCSRTVALWKIWCAKAFIVCLLFELTPSMVLQCCFWNSNWLKVWQLQVFENNLLHWQDWIGLTSGRNLKGYGLRVEFSTSINHRLSFEFGHFRSQERILDDLSPLRNFHLQPRDLHPASPTPLQALHDNTVVFQGLQR